MAGFLFLTLAGTAGKAFAAEADAVLPVSQEFSNNAGQTFSEDVTYALRPLDSANPMPAAASGESFTLSGDDSVTLTFQYTKPGIYAYEIYTTREPEEGLYLDTDYYKLEVYVRWNESGELYAVPIVYLEDGTKLGLDSPRLDFEVYADDIELEKEVSEGSGVNGVGDVISWDITYPMGPGLKRIIDGEICYAKDFYIDDEMDPRLTYIEYAVLEAYGQDDQLVKTLSRGTDYTETTEGSRVIWNLDNSIKWIADNQIKYLLVHFDTLVNENAASNSSNIWNNAEIEFENATDDPYTFETYSKEIFNPDDITDDGELPDGAPKAAIGSITVYAGEDGDKSKPVSGVKFGLAKTLEDAQNGNFIDGMDSLISDEDGKVQIDGLGYGTYYLVELETPEGYELNSEVTEVVISNDPDNSNTETIASVPKKYLGVDEAPDEGQDLDDDPTDEDDGVYDKDSNPEGGHDELNEEVGNYHFYVGKTVDGNDADYDQFFDFTLKLTKPSGETEEQTYHAYVMTCDENGVWKYTSADSSNTETLGTAYTGTVTFDGVEYGCYNVTTGTDFGFKLKHNQRLVFTMIGIGVKYEVTEEAADYCETSFAYSAGGTAVEAASALAAAGKNAVDVTNTMEIESPTGIVINNLPYLVIAVLVAAIIAVSVIIRGRRRLNS
ncbi:MAG: isopeptide-forming domain-containing fimbrial protein [Lachnospiraceae bacterium]|nr:isopeptide-forming domain-containing fimbrial protein [Lachnospiraceae bacterium]